MGQRRWLLLALALLPATTLSEDFELTSPENVVGIVGQDTILPCTISSTKPLDNPEVQWRKITGGHTEDIYTYKQFGGEPRQKYYGRTSVPKDGFATGNVSLTLKNVQPADEGLYSCTVTSKDWGADTATKLSIAGTGEVFPEILGPQGRGLELGCRSHGWFPKPTVQWVTEDGQGLPADTEIHQDSEKLFSVWSRVTVTGEQKGKVTCQILNLLVQVEKKSTVLISDASFSCVSPFVPAFWTIPTLSLLALVAGAVLVFRGLKKLLYYKEKFELTSPENVVGIVGQDTILPCTISSTKPLDNPEVQWRKITDGHTEDIYTYKQFGGEPRQKYYGRTSVPKDGFATGNVSLTLKNVQPADEGLYSCTVTSRDWSADTATKLSIEGTGEVIIEILGPQGRGLELGCRSHGWFPKPTVQWVTEDGQGLFADTEIQQDSRKLFSVWSRVPVTGEQKGKVTCQILNSLVQVEKKTTVSLSGTLFTCVSPFVPAFWTILTLSLLALVAGAVLVFRGLKKLLYYKGLYELQVYEEVVTLDADTAHPRLEITGWGVVKDTAVIRDVPSNEKRFDTELIVLAEEGYTSGKHFWQVDVWQRASWVLGVALESVTRKGPLIFSPENGFWVIGLRNGVDYWAYTDPWSRLKVSGELPMIGILLNIPGKKVTFYDTIGGETLYTFNIADGSSLKRKFIPLFSTGPAAAEPDPYGLAVM